MLKKVLNMIELLPRKAQKAVLGKVDFDNNTPRQVFDNIIDTMLMVVKNAQQKEMLELYKKIPFTDEELEEAFGGKKKTLGEPSLTDDQVAFIKERVYRNRDGKFRLIPADKNATPESIPLEGLDCDEDIIAARLTSRQVLNNGATEEYNGLKQLRSLPYEPPYEGVFATMEPNLSRINIISSFESDYGFFIRDGKMYRNVCARITEPDPQFIDPEALKRVFFLMYLVAGANGADWQALYQIVHFIVRVPDSATGYILYLNDFDAGGNGKSKFISVLQQMFGDSFTSFGTQQLRFTMSLMGKRLVSISEFEETDNLKVLQGMLKSMTGRDKFQYEGKGVDPIVAETYQNFVISSNRYIFFEDSGVKRRLQNFHCSNLLHVLLTKYCRTHDYLNNFFGDVYDGASKLMLKKMAHSLLDYIWKDNNTYHIPLRPQNVVLGSLKNPVLRALFSGKITPSSFIRATPDGSQFDLYRLSADAKPEQLNYAVSCLQSWFDDIRFEPKRDCSAMTCSLSPTELGYQLSKRLDELDESSKSLRSKNGAILQSAKFAEFNAVPTFFELFGDTVVKHKIPCTTDSKGNLKIGE